MGFFGVMGSCHMYLSTEAEYMALSDCAHQVIWIWSLLGELSYKLNAILICSENQGSIFMASNPVTEPHYKHIDICYHRICKSVVNGKVELFFIDGAENPADLLTKNLPCKKFVKFGLTVSLWQLLAPYSLKCSTCSTVRGSVEVTHAPGTICQQSAYKYVVPSTKYSVDLVIVLFSIGNTCHRSCDLVTCHTYKQWTSLT